MTFSQPTTAGLYDSSLEKDSCGVGFIVNILHSSTHDIVRDASTILCNMIHRGGGPIDDGDGAGVMTAIPHKLLVSIYPNRIIQYQYAFGNIFFSRDEAVCQESKNTFQEIALRLGLTIIAWRECPVDNSRLGPISKSKEPVILQPIICFSANQNKFDPLYFNRQLYLLKKQATHAISLSNQFYICSLSNEIVIYKGQLSPPLVYVYFLDLVNPLFESHFALVHSRFSTNTFPSWDRAQPMRWCAHNGEINTLQGNKNWMRAREGVMKSSKFEDMECLYPIIEPDGSDSAAFDNVLELLIMNGKVTLPEAVAMLIPEAWQNQPRMDTNKKAFYEWAACLQEPWDGPALFTFSDGRFVGASLDRNGLRPCRFYLTSDDRMICASEVGTINIDSSLIIAKGRLQPGKMLLVDTLEGRIVDDSELKMKLASRFPFRKWLDEQLITMENVRRNFFVKNSGFIGHFLDPSSLQEDKRMLVFGFNYEELHMIVTPMALQGIEAIGSMGNDVPLACLSQKPRLIYDYFRQLFAQVTNPPIDSIRESLIMSLTCYVGPQGNILNEANADHCHRLRLSSPILSMSDISALKSMSSAFPGWEVAEIDITFSKYKGEAGYVNQLDNIFIQVNDAILSGAKIAILSDRLVDNERVPLSALVACAGVHHYLVKNKMRSKIALVVETGEARDVHHFCCLLGYGADAICPYLALEAIMKLRRDGLLKQPVSKNEIVSNFIKASDDGIKKVMSKMGISTLQSYKGAQIFEALGLGEAIIKKCFEGTPSRISGLEMSHLAFDALACHKAAYPYRNTNFVDLLPENGDYHYRDGGELHINDPNSIASLQDAVRRKNENAYDKYANQSFEQIKSCTLRGMLDFDFSNVTPVPLDEVEPWTEIVKRFVTGAMSYGSISIEAHSTLAIAMNKLGGKSNTGEGGEDSARSKTLSDGSSMRSAIKQIASARFGVTSFYLSDANEIQIKMAQGAKPGEGGELPGKKVSEGIAKTRKSTPGVGLISPPPHHDVYSIEDLKQLIYDCKCANPEARISVKLVSEVGVGIVASGVAKARADHILISGHDGGTGAARWTGIKCAGIPWELGLAETHQTLVLNDLRGLIVLQTDGQIKTGRDVVVSCLLGAEEWGFATMPLIALGCTMMRKCHLNTCPVGIATQDPELRRKFEGKPEDIINLFYFIAEHTRKIMASLGFRTINEMIGRCDLLKTASDRLTNKSKFLDLSHILTPAFKLRPGAATFNVTKQNHMLHKRIDNKLISLAAESLKVVTVDAIKITNISVDIVNTDRAFGTTLSYHISRVFGEKGLPDETIIIKAKGSAGQSFAAFLAPGVLIELEGDCNDYVGKGLSGGKLVVYPPKDSIFESAENVIVGNVCLYGATSGYAFISGIAAERFCVRNSGAIAVIEGVGDHGCEYMTGGVVVCLGKVGRNFAAGMSGGYAYILDLDSSFESNCNKNMVDLETVNETNEIHFLRSLIAEHVRLTESKIGKRVLRNFLEMLPKFVKVFPQDLKNVMSIKSTPNDVPIQSPLLLTKLDQLDIEDTLSQQALNVGAIDKLRGFMKYSRKGDVYRVSKDRIQDWKEVSHRLPPSELKLQAARCMDCGVAFCQSGSGCPVSNIIPKWNELVFNDQWKDALDRLLLTNNFPEFTGRVCPAPCESACVLGINEAPVSIKSIECAIIDKGFEKGWISPNPPAFRTGKKISIIGSGPAGLAAADQLNKAGHLVTVYDRNDRHGGLLMYGIPNMKLEKMLVQRRIDYLKATGIKFVVCDVGPDNIEKIKSSADALLLCIGATWPRDLQIPNRDADGIHFAMEFLSKNTKSLLDYGLKDDNYLNAKDLNVVVIGGGDTGNDCIGTAVRHGAKSITNFEILPASGNERAADNPWPQYARVMKIDCTLCFNLDGHQEVIAIHSKDPREYSILSTEFVVNENNHVRGINTIKVEWNKDENGAWKMIQVANSEKFYHADLVLISMGFLGPENPLIKALGLEQDARYNIKTTGFMTSIPGIFAAGDCRRGQSLVVWGIQEGRLAAREIDLFLMGNTLLPGPGGVVMTESVVRR